MRIAELMDSEVPTVGPEATLADAAVALRSRHVSAVVVTDGDRPLGILTERDFVQSVVDGADPATTPARERMTTDLVTLGPDDDAEQAGALMVANGFRHVPVVDGGRLVGMITQHQHVLATAGRSSTTRRSPRPRSVRSTRAPCLTGATRWSSSSVRGSRVG